MVSIGSRAMSPAVWLEGAADSRAEQVEVADA